MQSNPSPFGKTSLPKSPSVRQCLALLEEFYFNSLEPPSGHITLINAGMTGGPKRSAETLQYTPVDTEFDLDLIARHRRVRRALINLPRHHLAVIDTHHTEDLRATPQVLAAFGDYRFLALMTPTVQQHDANRTPRQNLQSIAQNRFSDTCIQARDEAIQLLTDAINAFQQSWKETQ